MRRPDHRVPELVVGVERVDLAAALRALAARGFRTVRVDSGSTLIGALLRANLLDELSLLVRPCLIGERGDRAWHGPVPAPPTKLGLLAHEDVGGGLVWLRYRPRP